MKQKVIIAGAGISVAPPSNLPSWWEYNKKLIVQIKEQALNLCPEAKSLLEYIDVENKLPVQCISQIIVSEGAGESYFPLLKLLNGTAPNANHFALVELAKCNLLKAIITTNFDTLIESAFQSEAVPLYTVVQKNDYYEAAQITDCKLFKIHGTINDDTSLIDTVSQKAVGLSPEKRWILETIFLDSDIYVIGYSGADLDFDLDYIPLAHAIESGSRLTWIIRPDTAPNSNVEDLQRRYPHNVFICKTELREFFESLNVPYRGEQPAWGNIAAPDNEEKLSQKIKELFSSAHIGSHGCVGYCLTLLNMIGADDAAKKLAKIYEEKLDWSALNVLSVVGIQALAMQKLRNKDWHGAIRCFQAVIQCHQHLISLKNKLQMTANSGISPEQNRKIDRESAKNLAAAYINLASVYYYMAIVDKADTLNKAKEFLGLAQSQLQQAPDILAQSLVTFGLARIEYQLDHNFDRYINALRISSQYAQKAGRLDSLVEILFEECRVRMQIGEYYLAKKSLDFSKHVLKNVGRTELNETWASLNNEYLLRTGEREKLLTDEMLMVLLSGVESQYRQSIIWFAAKRQTEKLAPLFNNLCIEYTKNKDWQRLWEVAQCCYSVACTNSQRSDALYSLGCAATELAKYSEAIEYFSQIVDIGKGVNDLKLGWAHSELARLIMKTGDIPQAITHMETSFQVLQEFGDLEALTQATANHVATLFSAEQTEQAEKIVTQLLTVIDDSNAAEFKKYLNHLRQKYGQHAYKDILNEPPHVIATQALSLYDSGDTMQAWELMRGAKEKYKKEGNLDGVGKCENNMGMWCLTEKNNEQAIAHLKAAMDIKFSLGDVGGGINQLSALLQIHTKLQKDLDQAEKLAQYAEMNMPLYAGVEEQYLLYYALAIYKLWTHDFAMAFTYAKKAEEGSPYLSKADPNCIAVLQVIINQLEEIFTNQPISTERSDFEIQVLEAERLGNIGDTDKCLAIVDRLKKIWGEDHLKNGILEGTSANAFLHAGKYTQAIKHYRSAIKSFENVVGNDRETAANHRLTAINGTAIALEKLERAEEAITLLRRELTQTNMPYTTRCIFTISLCNRLVGLHQDRLQKNDSVFQEICEMLDSLIAQKCFNHEILGSIYCVYGLLNFVVGDKVTAKQYYQQAKQEFLIVNSKHLAEVDEVLKKNLC